MGSELKQDSIAQRSYVEEEEASEKLLPSMSYCSIRNSRSAFRELASLRQNEKLCDVVLIVEDRRISAHKIILSACSPYFKTMFTGEFAESRQTEVTMRDIDGFALQLIVDFCYTSHIVVDQINVQLLLPAACLLQMLEIRNICCKFLHRELASTNCLGIRDFAEIYSCMELKIIADKFIRINFLDVMVSEEFSLLNVSQLENIISNNELNIFHEELVFDAVMIWVRRNVAKRRQHLYKLLQHVRLHLIQPKNLIKRVESDILVRSDESCRALVETAKKYHLPNEKRPNLIGPRIRPKLLTKREVYYNMKPSYNY